VSRRRIVLAVVLGVVLTVLAVVLMRGVANLTVPQADGGGTQQGQQQAAAAVPHITATLYYASATSDRLVPQAREVPLAEGTVEQGRQIVLAQLAVPPQPLLSTIPQGTSLRAFYVTDRGDAFVDLSPEISSAHPGGSLNELFTVYTIVNAVTTNLPAISRVQILLDGRESDTLAGHVDLRRPLEKNLSLVGSR
jgi:spore germination protein GerM